MQECSLLTFMCELFSTSASCLIDSRTRLYLNSPQDGDYKGGSTNFITRDKKLKYEVVPTTGTIFLFSPLIF